MFLFHAAWRQLDRSQNHSASIYGPVFAKYHPACVKGDRPFLARSSPGSLKVAVLSPARENILTFKISQRFRVRCAT